MFNLIDSSHRELQTPAPNAQTCDPIAQSLLSPCEAYFWRLEESFPGSYRIAAVFRLDGYLNPTILRAALDRVQQRHPKLTARIIRGSDGRLRYSFNGTPPPITLKFQDYNGKECCWREEARRLLQLPISAAGPFLAFSVLRNHERDESVLILSVHHAIADGISAMMLVDDLLTEFGRFESQSPKPARPVLELVSAARAREVADWKDRWWLLRRFTRMRIKERFIRQTALPESPQLQPVPQWEHWVLSPEETSLLVERCRQERASLAGALLSAAYCGLMCCLPGSEAWFKAQIPFSMRESAEGPPGGISAYDVGCFVSQMNQFHRVAKPLDHWGLARSARESIVGFVEKGGPAMCYNLTAMAGQKNPTPSTTPVMSLAKQRATLLVTNYGKVRLRDTYGSLHLREAMTTFNNFPDGASLVMAALTVGTRLNVGFAAGNLEPGFWHRLRDEVRGNLNAMIQPAR